MPKKKTPVWDPWTKDDHTATQSPFENKNTRGGGREGVETNRGGGPAKGETQSASVLVITVETCSHARGPSGPRRSVAAFSTRQTVRCRRKGDIANATLSCP